MTVVVDAGKRALTEEDDLVRWETEVVVLFIEWVKDNFGVCIVWIGIVNGFIWFEKVLERFYNDFEWL